MRRWLLVAMILASTATQGFAEPQTNAQTLLPLLERKVEANVITSRRDPAVRITLPKSVRYVEADRFVLKEIADCELHVFVEADEDKNVHRLYWVQFEGYLPSKPGLKYTYDSPRHTEIGALDFFVDTSVGIKDAHNEKGSDGEHVRALLQAEGYHMPAGTISVRLVHLLDEAKRQELMFIYSEDVALSGFTATDLLEGGKAHDRWPTIETGLIERAKGNISLMQ